MLSLTIINLEIEANTNGGKFFTEIKFSEGLNIIRAENSSGKSTCINAIAYGLGLESILGPSRKRPFPKSLYEVIFDSKPNIKPFFVSSSNVSIRVKNKDGLLAKLKRDIKGDDKKITVTTENGNEDLFLGSAVQVGSANSQRGFHHWLAEFIGWNLPNVVTFEGKETKLYLECIFPLFFIEQKRGWSEIQANIPNHYGIKNLKKSAIEFCLSINSFEHEKKITELKKSIDRSESEWDELRLFSESIADFNVVRVNKLPNLSLDEDKVRIRFSYLENNIFVSLEDQEISLRRYIKDLLKSIADNTPSNDSLIAQQAIMRDLRREIEDTSNSVEMLMISLSEVEGKITTLKHDHNQYLQLKRLRSVGGDISTAIETKKCPICESDLYDTLGNRTIKREPMSLDENIGFLKNQLDFFESIKKRSLAQLNERMSQAKLLAARFELENNKLDELKADLDDVNGETKSLLREQINAEYLLNSVLKLKASQEDLNEQAGRIHSSWSTATQTLKLVKKNATTADSGLIINKLESIIKGNLADFNFNTSDINSISISHQSLRPEQEGYDIVAETSASDYIRIIWSYTLALLELAGKEDGVKHGGFVVFDEPRQHEASKVSFTSLIEKAAKSKEFGGQVIFATSLDESELKVACENKAVNLVCFDDYILQLEKSTLIPDVEVVN